MDEKVRKLLYDVKMAIDEIDEFCNGYTYELYRGNRMLQSAVERQFEIIGEALSRLRKVDLHIFNLITDSERIIGLRNVIAHGYDIVDVEILWNVYIEKIPVLSNDISKILMM